MTKDKFSKNKMKDLAYARDYLLWKNRLFEEYFLIGEFYNEKFKGHTEIQETHMIGVSLKKEHTSQRTLLGKLEAKLSKPWRKVKERIISVKKVPRPSANSKPELKLNVSMTPSFPLLKDYLIVNFFQPQKCFLSFLFKNPSVTIIFRP